MHTLIKDHQCDRIPEIVLNKIMKLADQNGDGHIDFEEFLQLNKDKPHLFKQAAIKYCTYVIPKRDWDHEATSEPLQSHASYDDTGKML